MLEQLSDINRAIHVIREFCGKNVVRMEFGELVKCVKLNIWLLVDANAVLFQRQLLAATQAKGRRFKTNGCGNERSSFCQTRRFGDWCNGLRHYQDLSLLKT